MATLTITHTPADGTRLDGTTRDDGAAELLTRAGWWWVQRIGWHLPGSRDHTPRHPAIEATANRLRAAGYRVEIAIEHKPAARSSAVPANIVPPASLASIDRRIVLLEAKHGRSAQALTGYRDQLGRDVPSAEGNHRARLEEDLSRASAELEQLRARRAEMIDNGEAPGLTQADIRHGDEVQHRGTWLRAVRVNKRTVTAQSDTGRFRKLYYAEISAARPGPVESSGRGG